MKILLIGSAGKYGAQLSLFYLAKKLREKGCEVIVVLPRRGDTEAFYKKENIKCIIIPNCLMWYKQDSNIKNLFLYLVKSVINYFAEKRIYYIIKREKIDIVHLNTIGIGIGIKSCINLNIKLIWHIREFVEEGLNRKFYNKNKTISNLKKANKVIVISKILYNYYLNILDKDKLILVYNGIEEEKFLKCDEKEVNKRYISIVSIGRICKDKNQRILVEAIKYLPREKIKIYFIGDDNGDKTEKEYLEREISNYGLEKIVNFWGYTDNISQMLNQMDICVVSSFEGFGRVTIEAMLKEVIVIGANIGATTELLDEERGVLYQDGDVFDLAKKIMLVKCNYQYYYSKAKKVREYALKYFTASKNANEIYKIYSNILRGDICE